MTKYQLCHSIYMNTLTSAIDVAAVGVVPAISLSSNSTDSDISCGSLIS